MLHGLRAIGFLPPDRRAPVAKEFLDNIEPSERVYHLGDPVAVIREALKAS